MNKYGLAISAESTAIAAINSKFGALFNYIGLDVYNDNMNDMCDDGIINRSTGSESLYTLSTAVKSKFNGKAKGMYASLNAKLNAEFDWHCVANYDAGAFNYGKSIATDANWDTTYDSGIVDYKGWITTNLPVIAEDLKEY